jgi:hypothetical protein
MLGSVPVTFRYDILSSTVKFLSQQVNVSINEFGNSTEAIIKFDSNPDAALVVRHLEDFGTAYEIAIPIHNRRNLQVPKELEQFYVLEKPGYISQFVYFSDRRLPDELIAQLITSINRALN